MASARRIGLHERVLLPTVASLVLAGCLFPQSTLGTGEDDSSRSGSSSTSSAPQCDDDADCAHFDTDQDVCTRAVCRYGRCDQDLLRGTPECQCHADEECSYFEKACSFGTCEAHKCLEHLVPAGPAPEQEAGDCLASTCDGTTAVASERYEASDVPDDQNECTTEVCEEGVGLKRTVLADGTSCAGGGVCFKGECMTCAPQNTQSCGGEGDAEPQNDTSAGPASMPQWKPFCAFSSATDVDWYTFYANDADFSYDLLRFEFWSTAPTIEVCAYVKCVNGATPGGGCSTKLAGPGGSLGCCWSGAPASVKPSWDLDCPGTGEDSGTVYVSVRTPSSDACETYAMYGGY